MGKNRGLIGSGLTPLVPSPSLANEPATPLNGEFAQALLRPLAFRMAARADAGECVAIGQPLRRSLEHALNEAADRLDLTDSALRDLFLAMKAENTPLRLRTAAAVLRAKTILFRRSDCQTSGGAK